MHTHKQSMMTVLRIGVAVLIVSCVCGLAISSAAAPANPKVLPPNSKPYGKSYGEWNAEFWKWAFSMPITQNPLFDTADASEGNSGKVWFIGGAFAVIENQDGSFSAVAERTAAIPAGTALFFPVLNVECATAEGNGTTFEELAACAKAGMDNVTEVNASIDGVTFKNLFSYRAQSGLDTWGPLPEDDLFEAFGVDFATGTTSPFVAEGISLMIAPLSAGEHLIKFGGTSVSPGPFVFHLDITYHITVEPAK